MDGMLADRCQLVKPRELRGALLLGSHGFWLGIVNAARDHVCRNSTIIQHINLQAIYSGTAVSSPPSALRMYIQWHHKDNKSLPDESSWQAQEQNLNASPVCRYGRIVRTGLSMGAGQSRSDGLVGPVGRPMCLQGSQTSDARQNMADQSIVSAGYAASSSRASPPDSSCSGCSRASSQKQFIPL